jgi:YVTN family beta-propeller protein
MTRTPPVQHGATRAVYVRRRIAVVAAIVGLVLLAMGLVQLVRPDSGGSVARSRSDSTATGTPTPSSRAGGQPAASAAPTGGPPRRLTVRAHPSTATVSVVDAAGRRRTGRAPYTVTVSGPATVVVKAAGYQSRRERVPLRADRTLDVWLDPPGLLHHKLGEFTSDSNPKQVAFTPDSKQIWVTSLGGKGVEVFDAATLRRTAKIPLVGKGGVEVIFTADGTTAYVSQMQTASVYEIDRKRLRITRVLRTSGSWTKVVLLSPDESKLYAANWSSHDVSEFDLATGKELRRIKTVSTPRGLFVTPDGKRMYVAGYDNGEIQRIDLATGRGKVLLRTGGAMRHLVGDPDKGVVYADDMAGDTVFTVDLGTEKVAKLARTDRLPNTIDLTPGGRVLYVSNRGRNGPSYYNPGPEWGSVVVIDTATGRILDAIVGGNQTTGLDVSPDGRLLAYSDFLDNRVCVFRIPPYDVLAAGDGGRAQEHKAELQK